MSTENTQDTGNEVNIEEIKNTLIEKGYVVQSKEEHENYLNDFEDRKIKPRTREFAENIEKDVYEAWGEDKLPGEKYHEYLKRGYQSLKSDREELLKKAASPSTESDDLKSLKKDNESLRLTISEYTKKFEEQTLNHQKEKEDIKKASILNDAVRGLDFDADERVREVMVKNSIEKLLSSSNRFQDDKLVFLDDDGVTITNPQNEYRPKTAMDFLKEELSPILKTKKEPKGSGLDRMNGTEPNANNISKVVSIPSDVNTLVKLDEYLLKQGIPKGSAEFQENRERLGKEYNLRLGFI